MLPADAVVTFATGLARQAGAVLLEHYRNGNFDPSLKGDRSVVTLADVASDRLIAAAIHERFPSDLIVSEELNPYYPTEARGEAGVWIVDPLDGTTNFSLGFHFWGVLLARLVDGWPQTSVMYFPLIDEIYVAQRGQGAWFNDQPLHIQPPSALRPLSFFACCSRTHKRYHVSIPYKERIVGSTAYTLCTVARSIAVIGFEATPKIWDLAAPWLLVSEAGGALETHDGSRPFPLQTGVDYAHQSYPILAGATQELVEQARQQITLK